MKFKLYRTPFTMVATSPAMCAWAKEAGCPWDTRICAAAALQGNLKVLKYVRKNGCPWDWRTYQWAGNNAVKDWVQLNNCPDGVVTFISESESITIHAKNLPTLPNLTFCGLTVIPSKIGQLVNLTYLCLSTNNISVITPEIAQLVNLTYLHLSYNNISCLLYTSPSPRDRS